MSTALPRPIPVFPGREARALIGSDLREALLADVETARGRLWASYFLVGLEPRDERGSVRFVLDAFVRAAARGIDLRLLMDDFRVGPERGRANAVAAGYLADRGVNVRIYDKTNRSSHSKYLIVDESVVIVGSANLTPGGLDHNNELSVRVASPDLARELASRFELGWAEATPWSRR